MKRSEMHLFQYFRPAKFIQLQIPQLLICIYVYLKQPPQEQLAYNNFRNLQTEFSGYMLDSKLLIPSYLLGIIYYIAVLASIQRFDS